MATGATGTPTTNYSIPKYATSADAPNGTGFNSAMDAIDLALKGVADARLEVHGTPGDGKVPVYDSGDGFASWADASNPSVTPIQLLNPFDSNSFWLPSQQTAGMFGRWEFVKDLDGFIYGEVLVPSGVTNATLRAAVAANATSGVTRLALYAQAWADAETMFGSWNIGNPVSSQDITVPGTAYTRKDVTWSLTGLTGGDLLFVAVQHNGTHANDTLAVNTLLYGAWLEPA